MTRITKLLSVFILYPVLLFILTFIGAKFFLKRKKAFGLAADVTTLLLFFSVSNAFSIVFSKNIVLLLIMIALLIATLLTYLEWRNEKEIEVMPLLRRIWRFLFLLLCLFYIVIWIIGVIRYVLAYIS
ncbi:DUF3397 family protein [Psychrobacillus sp.]|uniref:DUF3397 family protein n=1 Tax=Psychrobacillus sp. TaxID=1871623 RepID=UPI0028BF2243|nr:DUF3397 family protein [Psychrobacillus sp.]